MARMRSPKGQRLREEVCLISDGLGSGCRLPNLPLLPFANELFLQSRHRSFPAILYSPSILNRMTPEYKADKEASVSHLGGGGVWEINHVTLVAPVCNTYSIFENAS